MQAQASDLVEKIRQQFDSAPYPRISLDESPKDKPNLLYIHSLVTAYYLRNQKVIDTKGKVILDAGCGSGYKSLVLAEANPGAKIIGVDISEESVKLARQRLEHHGFDNTEFHVSFLEDLPKLGVKFDYINCDDVLYLLPDAVKGLQAMKAVLQPDGIMRVNLHSSLQRANFFRAQNLFKFMGLMNDNPEDMEIGIVQEIMNALKDGVSLKAQTWSSQYNEADGKDIILANQLLVGDKGATIPEFFSLLKAANLEFIKMVNWWQWDLMALFKEPDDLPAFLGMSLPELSAEQKLHLFELFHPIHRLLDLYCGNPNQAQSFVPVEQWTDSNWENAKVHLHPQLKTPKFREELISCITEIRPFIISEHLQVIQDSVSIDSSMSFCLIPLLEQPQSMTNLAERWKQVRPLDPVTLEPTDQSQAFYMLQQLFLRLESLGYVMLEGKRS
ncbi:class I SAM-dependent methyltransferase [Plectonema cf. radiosum LEGE 06105]|uniref:Class I SAM-dependent methyltransferase n=1 Tax=Plectonema cf. radiosum LEGE 06105 TaxID=945769 RepID=A0A8J7F993_9CYAN|nr:methyltransferase domain-containing protein [Plectonema radiosum]MBE9213949.1 class I SAM-dependent methyltransferase [Plectonema cf. radiosum LEGE 06105]